MFSKRKPVKYAGEYWSIDVYHTCFMPFASAAIGKSTCQKQLHMHTVTEHENAYQGERRRRANESKQKYSEYYHKLISDHVSKKKSRPTKQVNVRRQRTHIYIYIHTHIYPHYITWLKSKPLLLPVHVTQPYMKHGVATFFVYVIQKERWRTGKMKGKKHKISKGKRWKKRTKEMRRMTWKG